jgi:hypothetical protein
MKLFEELQSGTDERRMRLRLHAAEANPVSSRPMGSCSSLVAPRSFSPPSLRPEPCEGEGVASPSRDAGSPARSLSRLCAPAGVLLPTCHELNTARERTSTTYLESGSCGLDSLSSFNSMEQGGGRGSQAVQGGSQAVQGGSQAVQGGSQAVQGGSQAVQGGSQAVQGGSLKNFFRSRSLPRSERERRAEDERRRRAEAAVLPKPERRLARQAGRGALLTQRDGSLFPLYTDTRTFGE